MQSMLSTLALLMVPGAAPPPTQAESDGALKEAMMRLPPAKAASEVARLTGGDRKALYAHALTLQGK